MMTNHPVARILVFASALIGANAHRASAQGAIALFAECAEPDRAHAGQQLVQFGYASAGAAIDRPYGPSNNVAVGGIDAGPLSGAPARLDFGVHGNAFTVRAAAGALVTWSVLDPVTFLME